MRSTPSPELGVTGAESAALQAVIAAEASATAGIAQGRIAYLLTYNMIKQKQGALSLPLIALAFTAITAGLEAYARTQAAWVQADAAASRKFQAALRRSSATSGQTIFRDGIDRLNEVFSSDDSTYP